MFEDKRFKNNDDSNNFFMPDNSTGLKEGNDNLNFREQPVIRKQVEPKKERKKIDIKKLLLLIMLIVMIISFIGGGYLVFKSIFNNPYKIYKNVINYGFDYVDTHLNDFYNKKLDYDKNKDILTNSGSFSINSNLLEKFKGYEFKYKASIDLNKEMVDTNLVISKDKKNVLNIESMLRDKKILVYSKDIYEKYLEVKNEENIDLNSKIVNFNNKILNDILNNVKVSIINDLDKNKMSTEKIKINVQNKSVNVISNKYTLSREDVKKLYQNIIDSLINDKDLIDNLADIFNLRKMEIKEFLENLKFNESILDSFKDLEICIYTNGIFNKVIGAKIVYDNKELINYTNYKSVINVFTNMNDVDVNVSKDQQKTKLEFRSDSSILNIFITKKDDKISCSFDLEVDKLEAEGVLEIAINRLANKKITMDILFDLKGKNDKDDFDMVLKFDNIIQVGGTIQNIPNNNIVNYDSLNESEKQKIKTQFNNIMKELSFLDNEETLDYCEVATDCECLGSICTCFYIDNFGIKQSVNCLKNTTVS